MTSNVAFERSFAELSNGHEFSIVSVFTLANIIKTSCPVFFCSMVTKFHGVLIRNAAVIAFLKFCYRQLFGKSGWSVKK